MKKIIICLLSLSLLISSNSVLFAVDHKNTDLKEVAVLSERLQKFSEETGMPLSELEKLNNKLGVGIYQFMEAYNEATTFSDIVPYSGGNDDGQAMTPEQFAKLKNNALRGNILVSADQTTFGINHGHAAIVTTQGSKTVEALGPGILSKECNLEGWWSEMYTAKVLYHKTCTNSQQIGAAQYAYNNLRGKPYSVAPNVNDNALNCATLVWKAYKSQDIELNKVWLPGVGYTCFPKQLVEDPNLVCKYKYKLVTKNCCTGGGRLSVQH